MSPPAVARSPIRRLAPITVERIAAGEVVERPASVVKELVENAIDAGAGAVVVRLTDGGLRRIEVEDDGDGIPAAELGLALERHATSKLAPDGPIEGIGSLGFRGEALASIASVSRLRLWSRPRGAEVAEGIRVEGRGSTERFAVGRAPGTTVEVVDLFFNTPARLKFLRRPAAEQLEVVRTVERLYLARRDIGLRVEGEGRPLVELPPAPGLAEAVGSAIGADVLADSFVIEAPVPGGRVHGLLGRPTSALAHSNGLFLSVNGRTIQSRPIAQAVRAAYADHLPRGRFPVGVLQLELDDHRIDVNVHPTKREVRFSNETELREGIRRGVREALLAAPQIAERAGARPGGAARLVTTPPTERVEARAITTGTAQRRLSLDADLPSGSVHASHGRPALRLLGCIDRLYWIANSPDGLVLVDQHAASERAVYEALLRDGRLARQELVDPATIQLTRGQRATLVGELNAVAEAGFDVEEFGPSTVRVRAVPSYRGIRADPASLPRLLDELADGGRPVPGAGLRERRAASMACHAAIRAGDEITAEQMARVIAGLDGAPGTSYACPHGRPIFVQIPRSRLDRWFLRSGT